MVVVVRRDEHDLARELTERTAQQQIAEAMALLRRKHADTRSGAEVVHRPFHREGVGDGREVGSKCVASGVDFELDALQEQLRRGVGVLVGFDDVAARVGDERADARDDAGPVGALEQEHRTHYEFIGVAAPQNRVRSGSRSPRRRSRSISTQATPLLSAYTLAWGLICCATNMPAVGASPGSRSRRSW